MRQLKKARRFGGPAGGPAVHATGALLRHRRWRPDWPVLAALLALIAILFFLFLALGVSIIILLKVLLLAIAVAAYLAAIALLDGGSRRSVANRPLARTLACAALGVAIAFALLSLLRNGEDSWLLAGAVFGAALGWLGTGWARFL